MITDIPSSDDFRRTGLGLLDIAWDTAAGLVMDLATSEYMGPADPEMAAAFWEASRQRLSVSLATAQQAVEFILKSRIAAVSPFLLIGSLPRDWPRRCDQQNTQFADFRTIDAQDLLRVHDAVAPERLGSDSLAKFEELRKTRNAITHTVDSRISPRAADVVRDILAVYRQLFPDGNWFAVRREYLEHSPIAELYSGDFVDERLVLEFEHVDALLGPGELGACLGRSDSLKFVCPSCARAVDGETRSPRCASINDSSTAIDCILCGATTAVSAASCAECGTGLVSSEHEFCVVCGDYVV